MFQSLTKILPLPFYPPGFVSLALIGGLAAVLHGRRIYAVSFLVVGLVVLWTTSMDMTAHLLYRNLEGRYTQPNKYPRVSAVVLLGGSAVPPASPRGYPEVNAAGDRIIHAARVFRMGVAPFLVTSGGVISTGGEKVFTEAESSRDLLVELFGIDSSRILVEPVSFNTGEHPQKIAELLREHDLPFEIVLVTSAAHMYRSVRVFEKYGYTVHPAPTDYRTEEIPFMGFRTFLPNAHALEKTTLALHEYYGLIAYKLLGRI